MEQKMDMVLEYVTRMTQEMVGLKQDMTGMKQDITDIKQDITSVKKTVARIENDHGQKISALFDGLTQVNSRLDRIEQKVSQHDEVIYRRVK